MKGAWKILKNRRGMSLAEVIVAFAVISIVTVAAVTIIATSFHVESKAAETFRAQRYADNALQCFRYANDSEEFLNLWKATSDETGTWTDFNGYYIYVDGNWKVSVTAFFTNVPDRGNAGDFTVTVQKFEDVYLTLTYQKTIDDEIVEVGGGE